ncbi:MAG TPA: hypothetical protein VFX02_07180 [Gammaproteobacteria bacterium]|nr:hypothetical protein [Gammaproteobacteria bacterium]
MIELHLKRRLGGYIKTLQPLFAEMFSVFRFRVLFVIVASLMAVGLELGSLSLIYLLFKSGDKGISFLNFKLVPEGAWLALPVLLLACAAFMYFVSNFNVIRLASLFAEHLLLQMHRGLQSAAAWPPREYTRDFSSLRKLNRVQNNALMVSARVFKVVNSLWAPGLLFLGGFGLLFRLNFRFGLVVTCVLILLLFAQAIVSFKSARSSSRWEKVFPKSFAVVREDLCNRLVPSNAVGSEDAMKRALKNILSVLQSRLLAPVYSQLLVSIGLIVALSALLLYFQFGAGALLLQHSLPSVLALLAIVTRIFMSLRGVATRITGVNRFYPQLSRYSRLRRVLAQETAAAPAAEAVRSATILTDLPDNKLNRLRWRFILYGGREIDFDGKGRGLAVQLLNPAEPDKAREEYIWIDLDGMRNDPPVLAPAAEAPQIMQRFKIRNADKDFNSDTDDDEDDLE